MPRGKAEAVVFTEASTTIRAGRQYVAGINVHEDHSSAAVAEFALCTTSVSGTELAWVNLAANASEDITFNPPLMFRDGVYLKGSPTGQFTGTVRFV